MCKCIREVTAFRVGKTFDYGDDIRVIHVVNYETRVLQNRLNLFPVNLKIVGEQFARRHLMWVFMCRDDAEAFNASRDEDIDEFTLLLTDFLIVATDNFGGYLIYITGERK